MVTYVSLIITLCLVITMLDYKKEFTKQIGLILVLPCPMMDC